MRSSAVRDDRRSRLAEPQIAPLTAYVESLRLRDGKEYPDFDPADGGIRAEILFLFEKPGPMTVSKGRAKFPGSGFISRDNDDPTAVATFDFMQKAGIDRSRTVLWNVVPGWNGTRNVSAGELREGVEETKKLLKLLPAVKTIVLVGKKAGNALPFLPEDKYEVFQSAHPSPLVRGANRRLWDEIPSIWTAARLHADSLKSRY